MHFILGLFLSTTIGVSLGLIGGGGSIITVPVLVYVMDVDPREAISMSLAVVGVTSLIGVFLHVKKGLVAGKPGVLFASSGVLGAYCGSRLTYLVSPHILMLLFATLMVAIGIAMLVRKFPSETDQGLQPIQLTKALGAGFIVGGLTGFLGVGGGFLIVPALLLFGGLRMKEAVGTSLLVIAINCVAGLFGHLHQTMFDLRLAFLVTSFAAIGTLVGFLLAGLTSPARLRAGFAVFVIVVAVVLIAKNSIA